MALVGAHGQDGAAGRVVVRVGGWVAVFVHDPTGRYGFAAVASQGNFTGSNRRGRHVEKHLALQVAGHTDANWVGSQATGAPAKRRNGLGASSGVGGQQGDHALLSAHGGIIAQAANVALAADCEGGNAALLGLGDGHAGGPFGYHEPETPVAIDDGGGRRLAKYLERSAGYDVAAVNSLAVFGDVDDAVGIMPRQVSLNLMGRHDFGLIRGGAFGPVDVDGDFMQVLGLKNGHRKPP